MMMKLSSLFRKTPPTLPHTSVARPDLPAAALPLAVDGYGFPRPDWAQFRQWLGSQPEAEHGEWQRAAQHHWLQTMQSRAPDRLAITPSKRFLLLHPTTLPERIGAYTELLEKLTTRLSLALPGLAEPPTGQMPVLLFGQPEDYHNYSSHYYPAYGEYGLSGGMFLAEGMGHIALPYFGFRAVEPVLAHELTHAALWRRKLPRWLDEGLAVTFEHANYPHPGRETPFEQQRAHRALWNAQSIQRFWQGASFLEADEHQQRSYELARVLVEGLSKDRERFLAFVQHAQRRDAGEAAARERLGFSLGDAAAAYLGDGDWGPV